MSDLERGAAIVPAEPLAGDHGHFEITDEWLMTASLYSMQEFERLMLKEAYRRQLTVMIEYDFLRHSYVIKWHPAEDRRWTGVWKKA